MSAVEVTGLTSNLTEYLTELQKQQQEALTPEAVATTPPAAAAQADAVSISSQGQVRSQNLLSGNFVGGSTSDATYVNAVKSSFAARQSVQNSMDDALATSLESVIGQAAFWYGDQKMRNAKMLKDSTESHEELLTDIKDAIEEKAEEAAAPKDAEGKPIEQDSASAAVDSSAAGVTPQAPEAADAANAAAPAPAVSPEPVAAAPEAPAASIDITV